MYPSFLPINKIVFLPLSIEDKVGYFPTLESERMSIIIKKYFQMRHNFILLLFLPSFLIQAQDNLQLSDPLVENILKGSYEPDAYDIDTNQADTEKLDEILTALNQPEKLAELEQVLLRQDLSQLDAEERTEWVYSKLDNYSGQDNKRFQPFYLEYEDGGKTKKIAAALLPGRSTRSHDIVVVEALGGENTLGEAALALELAEIMSKLDFDSNLLFLININADQAESAELAYKKYLKEAGINVRARFDYNIIKGWEEKFPAVFMSYRGCRP